VLSYAHYYTITVVFVDHCDTSALDDWHVYHNYVRIITLIAASLTRAAPHHVHFSVNTALHDSLYVTERDAGNKMS
jgi:hypothetical protein